MAVEPTEQGNFHNGVVGLLQQLLSPLDSLLQHVLVEGYPHRLLELVAEMKGAETGDRRQIRQFKVGIQGFVDVIQR